MVHNTMIDYIIEARNGLREQLNSTAGGCIK